MNHPAWMLVILGLVLVGAGLIWIYGPQLPWLGRLPGDIVIERGNNRIYFPITTCILLSLILTGILSLVRTFSR